MTDQFCPHLQDYAELFARTREAYCACNEEVDAILGGQTEEAVDRLTARLDAWRERDRLLRQELVDLVAQGAVRIPASWTRGKKHAKGHPVCAECGFEIPHLATPEWHFAANGAAEFRGQELLVTTPESQEMVESGAEKVGV